MVNNIRNNTISEIDAKKDLNALNEIKNVEIIKYKKRTPGHKKLLNLFNDLLDIILTDKTLESESQEDKNKNENEKVESRKEENEKVESRKEENKDEDYENKYENEDEDDYYENENEDEDETMSPNEIIKNLNDNLDEIIDKSKSFEEQIESLKKLKGLKEYWFIKDFDDKELKFKIFKLKLADMSNEIEEELFEQMFGHTLIKLANKLINTINKEENQTIVKNI